MVEVFIEKLDQLVALKKVKGHKVTRAESDEYNSAWMGLIEEEKCFSDRVEFYLYEGMIFTGAKPFVNWIIAAENKTEALNTLFSGKLYGKDTTSTFRILISTLAHLIMSKSPVNDLICQIIRRIPQASINKEKKIIGDGHRIILKYFVSEIDESLATVPLSELDMNPALIGSFVKVFDELCSRINPLDLSKKDRSSFLLVNRWLHPDNIVDNQNPELSSTETSTQEAAQQTIDYSSLGEEKLFIMLTDSLKQLSIISEYYNNSIETQKTVLNETITFLQKANDDLNEQLEESRQSEYKLSQQLIDKNSMVISLNERIEQLKNQVDELSALVEKQRGEIGQRTQMMEALSRDRTKQSDELAHRVGAKLKIEYRDFKDAEFIPMDSDLGENMREQLKNVFTILLDSGITLE